MSIYVAQTVLTRMLRGATDVRVIVKLLSKTPARFSASFTINGQGDFMLCTDGFKPRRLSGMAEVESLVRRSCVALQTFDVTMVDFGKMGGKPKQTQKEISAGADKLGKLVMAAQRVIHADTAALTAINAGWAASAHKTQRIGDLTNEIQAAQGVIDLEQNGTLPDGSDASGPDPSGGTWGQGGKPNGWPVGAPSPSLADAKKFNQSLSDFIYLVQQGQIFWQGGRWRMQAT